MGVIIFGAALVVGFACLAFILFSVMDSRRKAVEDLSSLARIIAYNSTVAMEFGIPEDVEQLMAALETRPSVVLGAVYDAEGALFAQYRRVEGAMPATPPPVREPGHSYEDGRLFLFAPILHHGQHLGTIHLQDDLSSEWAALSRNLLATATILGLAMLLSLLAAYRLQQMVSQPILALTATARAVLENGDYKVRAAETSDDEVGVLASTFNQMLTVIESRDANLRRVNETLQEEVAERRRAQEALSHEKEFLSVTLRSIGDAVIATDPEGRVTFVNRVAELLTGWPEAEALGRTLREVFRLVHEETGEPVKDPCALVLATGKVVGLANHTVLVSRDGTRRAIADSAAPICMEEDVISGVVLVFRDVTEARKLEAELTRIQKLETVQVLAAGIAHDFNNLLSAILGFISLARRGLPAGDEAAGTRLQKAEAAVGRARDLTAQLLTFTSGGEPVRGPANLEHILRDAAAFALRGADTLCEFNIEEDLWPVNVDASQIGQVVQNFVLNAHQASPMGDVIHVSAHNRAVTPAASVPLPAGRYVEVAVTDTGVGIPRENFARIFDPFYSTKPKGSGLGLAVCFSVIKKHEGHIEFESVVGEGTTFHFWLHASEEEQQIEAPRLGDPPPGSGRILVMDDEPTILEVTSEMLHVLGYDAKTATNGAAAIDVYRRARADGRPFDAVILDLTIPGGMGGKDTLQALQSIDPEICAIVSSGYSSDTVLTYPREHGFAAFIRKPYDLDTLATTLADLLGSV